jgi:Flp pilus assembly protein TadD/mono/diheme cytochrome c family protein
MKSQTMPPHLKPASLRSPALCLAVVSALLILFFGLKPLRSAVIHASSPQLPSAQPTWSGHIARVLYNNCTTCHHPGGAGPFSLLTYEDARRWAPQIRTVTESRFMPPWLPEPGYGSFADTRRLTDDDLALIKRWVATGMAKGDPSTAPAAPTYSSTWTLGKPDLILTVEMPFTLAAGGEDVFHNFILPYPLNQTHYIRAMEILPSVPRIVHHANILIDRTAEYRHQHPLDWQQGVPGMDLVVDAGKSFDPDGHFLFWKPDTPVLVEPPGMPWRIDPDNDLILNMHLNPSGKTEIVEAQIGLYFTNEPPSQLPMLLQLDRDDALDIPAGQSSFIVQDEMTLPVGIHLLGIYPHAHYRGREMQCWAILPDQKKQWLIWIRNWDIDRQSVYSYKKPISLPRGTVLHMRYTYDNSAANPHNPHIPPVRVRAGNRSEDEMAHLWLQVLPIEERRENEPDPRLLLEEAWMRNRLSKTPNDYISLYNLGAALAAQGKSHDAVDIFRKILNNNATDGRVWNALGTATESEGDWQQAQDIYNKALAVEPGNCDARFNLARLDLDHNLQTEAETTFRALLAHCSDDADAHSGLGMALLREQQYEQARAEFLHALSLNPSAATALDLRKHLAFAYLQLGQISESITQLREAVRLAPEDPSAHALLAQVLARVGQLQEAIAEQKSALRANAKDADGWNNLGAFQARSGDIEAARYDFEQALRIDPKNNQAKANLSHLAQAQKP